LNHRKKTKADGSRLIPRKHAETPVILSIANFLLLVKLDEVNSIFSHVKRNNTNSEGVDGNEQCSSNVKEAPNRKRTKCHSIAKIRKWDDTYFRYGFFLPDDQFLNVAAKFQKCKNKRVVKFLAL